MAGTVITIKIEGLENARAKLTAARADGPIGRFLDRGAIFIQSTAKANAPVDTNRLRGSIGIEPQGARLRIIGANTEYAQYVEEGTKAHFVPAQYIGGWAKRHGLPADKGLFVTGKAQPYMKPAADAAEPFVKSLVPVLAAELEAAYSGGD